MRIFGAFCNNTHIWMLYKMVKIMPMYLDQKPKLKLKICEKYKGFNI